MKELQKKLQIELDRSRALCSTNDNYYYAYSYGIEFALTLSTRVSYLQPMKDLQEKIQVEIDRISTLPSTDTYYRAYSCGVDFALTLIKNANELQPMVINSNLSEIDGSISNSELIGGSGFFAYNSQTPDPYKLEIINWYKALTSKEKEYVEVLRIEAVDCNNED